MYTLKNAEFLAKKYATFRIPHKEDRNGLKTGDFAKLMFAEPGRHTERIWVRVTAVSSPGIYNGVISNDPVHLVDIKYGDAVSFQACHVIRIELYSEEPADIPEDLLNSDPTP